MKSSIWDLRLYISFYRWENWSSLRLSDLLLIRQLSANEPRTQVFRHGHEGFLCPRVLGPEPNSAIQKRGHPRPASKEASNPGLWSWKLHLEKNSGGLTSLWLTLRQRFLSWSWMCPTRPWDCAILQPAPTWRSLSVCLKEHCTAVNGAEDFM